MVYLLIGIVIGVVTCPEKDEKLSRVFVRFIVLILGITISAFYLLYTPLQVKDLTTQVNILTRQVEILEQNQNREKP